MLHISTDLPIIDYQIYHISEEQNLSHTTERFLCVLKGALTVTVDSYPYSMQDGDILYLPHETTYALAPSDTSLILYVNFHPCLMLTVFGRLRFRIKHFYSNNHPDQKNTLNRLFAELITQCLEQETSHSLEPCGIYARAYSLFHYISQHCLLPADSAGNKVTEKLQQLEQFLDLHYMEAVSLTDAADALEYTPQYLSNFLKKHRGMTFQDYLNVFRCDSAKLLLRYSKESLSKIAFLCGFPNQASFVKAFTKELSCTPEDYAAKTDSSDLCTINGIAITNPSLVRDYIFNYINYTMMPQTSTPQKKPTPIMAACGTGASLNPIWNFLINMGSARDFEKPTFRHHLTRIQNQLHFQYCRCTELFSLVKIYTLDGNTNYDFSAIFRLIDFLKTLNLKPFFDLDNKPFRLYKEPLVSNTDYQNFLSTESYDSFLFQVLPNFVKSCILRYGFDEFSTWKFELWRRYNTDLSSLEPPEVFCERFQKVADILKSLVPGAVLGGPGFNGVLSTEHFAQILRPFAKTMYQPDFISAYYFPYTFQPDETTASGIGYGASPTPDSMVEKLAEWKQMITEQGFGSLPFYITEYSSHLSLENYINDSIYPAVYTFHQAIQDQSLVDALGYWLATDLSLEYGRPDSPLFGGNGLLTKNGIRKTSFHAHDFLNRLGDTIISQGTNHIITVSKEGGLQILVYHFGILKQSFAQSPLSRELLHYPYSAFEESEPLVLKFSIGNIPAGNYRITEFTLDLNHGNVLTAWGHLNHATSIGFDETQYMDMESSPSMSIHTQQIQGLYTYPVSLNHNEARLITLLPVL